MRQFLKFLGMEDIEFVYAEGLAIGEAARQTALSQAKQAISRLSAPERMLAAA